MELKELLHMKAGEGRHSYLENQAHFTQKVASRTKSLVESAIQSLLSGHSSAVAVSNILNIADLGCAHGPATLSFINNVRDTVERICKNGKRQLPEVQMYLNDLPSNDFNSLFRDLSSLCQQQGVDDGVGGGVAVFAMGAPGSFYGRLFPANTLHLVHSNYSLQWLSQVPPGLCAGEGLLVNKGSVYISKTSPPSVAKAYLAQFEEDFSLFLKCRYVELVGNGYMVFSVRGRPSVDPLSWEPWELKLFAQALSCLVSQGLIEEEKVDSFNFPFYGASAEEIEAVVKCKGYFTVKHIETMKQRVADEIQDKQARAEKLANVVRSYSESLVSHHFGAHVIEPLYDQLARVALESLGDESPEHFSIAVLLQRNVVVD